MEIDQGSKKAKETPKADLQLLTYTRRKTTETPSESRSSRPTFSVQFFDSATITIDSKGKGPTLDSAKSPLQ